MKDVSSALRTHFETSLAIKQLPVVRGEWSWNQFANSVSVSNVVPDLYEKFPLESVIQPHRPKSGVAFAFWGLSPLISAEDDIAGYSSDTGDDKPYCILASEEEELPYTYWVGPTLSNKYSNAVSNCRPEINYDREYLSNKLEAQFETTHAVPTDVTVAWKSGGTWRNITGVAPNPDGKIELYYNGSTWTTTYNDNYGVNLSGVRLTVNYLSKSGHYVHLISFGANLVRDLTNDVIDINGTSTREEVSQEFPVGISSSNECSITLNNTGDRFNYLNTNSDLHGLLERNAKFLVGINHHFGSSIEYEHIGTFYAEGWPDSDGPTVSLRCTDIARFLQEQASVDSISQDIYPSTAVREILGVYGYRMQTNIHSSETQNKMPYIWSKSDIGAWETILEILRSDRAALYVNSDEDFVYESKEWPFLKTGFSSFIEADTSGGIQPNLINFNTEYEVAANSINISYRKLKENEGQSGPTQSILWQPDDVIALRASNIRADILAGSSTIKVWDAELWPYKGFVNVEGEIIEYEGKQYKYYGTFRWGASTHTVATRYIYDHAEKIKIDSEIDPAYSHLNGFTGLLKIKQRGVNNTPINDHVSSLHPAWSSVRWNPNTATHSYADYKYLTNDGRLRIRQQRSSDYQTYHMVRRGSITDDYPIYGTKLRFPRTGETGGMAGMALHVQDDNKSGYFIEVATNTYVANKRNNSIGNIRCYKINSDQSKQGLPNTPDGIRGYDFNIEYNRDYQLEVNYDARTRSFVVLIDGQVICSFVDNYDTPRFNSGKWGMFVRSDTWADFEYFYYLDAGTGESIEQQQLQRQVLGGYQSTYLRDRIHQPNHKIYFMEFSPIVHEIRQFEVDHTVEPAITSGIYYSNDLFVALVTSSNTPFRSRFTLSNASRDLAIVHGQDNLTLPGESIDHQLFLYGQAVVLEEEQKYSVSNPLSIRKYGKKEIDFVASWIQTEEHAKNMGDHFESRWSTPRKFSSAEVIMPPGLEVGDIIQINYPRKKVINKRYAVVSINYTYNDGLTAGLTLMEL